MTVTQALRAYKAVFGVDYQSDDYGRIFPALCSRLQSQSIGSGAIADLIGAVDHVPESDKEHARILADTITNGLDHDHTPAEHVLRDAARLLRKLAGD